VSPFQTPKKRFKYSSGVDLSGLVRSPLGHGREPVRGSPLKQSVTPSKLRDRLIRTAEEIDLDAGGLVEEDEGEGEDGDGGEQQKTPTKKVKYATRPGVDLEIAVPGPSSVRSGEKRKRVDTSAFFALRPGSRGTPTTMDKQWSPVVEDGLPEVRSRVRKEKEEGGERVRRDKVVVPRRDWTYAEIVWGSKEVVEENEKVLDQVRCLSMGS